MKEALLVMDMQRGIVARFESTSSPVLANVRDALKAARERKAMVIFVRIAFRDGAPEISPRNKSFAALVGQNSLLETSPETQIHPDLAPQENEVVVTKRRVSAFSGSDLDVLLRANQIDHLVLCGIATSGVVLSTLRQAADLDYTLSVLHDACVDADDEVHRVLMQRVFPRQASVISTLDWISPS